MIGSFRSIHYFWDNALDFTYKKCLFQRNPVGRTGMIGRGLLGKWGPNHAADPLVTRYIIIILYLPVLQAKRLFLGGGMFIVQGWFRAQVNIIVNAKKSCWGTYNLVL